jgi:hypothetical protein
MSGLFYIRKAELTKPVRNVASLRILDLASLPDLQESNIHIALQDILDPSVLVCDGTMEFVYETAKVALMRDLRSHSNMSLRKVTSVAEGKGRHPDMIEWLGTRVVNYRFTHPILEDSTSVEQEFYAMLWDYYFETNQALFRRLLSYDGYTDSLRPTMHVSRLRVIGRIVDSVIPLFLRYPIICEKCGTARLILTELGMPSDCEKCGTKLVGGHDDAKSSAG